MQIWKITIFCVDDRAYSIFGDGEGAFLAELRAWQAYQEQFDAEFQEAQDAFNDELKTTTGLQIREVRGFSNDTINQMPAILGYRFCDVEAIVIQRMI